MKKRILLLLLLFVFVGCARQTLSPEEQAKKDQVAIAALAEDLVKLPPHPELPAGEPAQVREEALLIATALVGQTRKTSQKFRMTGGPIWHNYLIKIGKREKGYCYDWVPELLKALPPYPLKFFERHWGGSFLSLGRENNAVILTRRAAPIKTGIVYDAWRGTGRPFWKKVDEDKKYHWVERFREAEILTEEATVEPLEVPSGVPGDSGDWRSR